MSDSLPSMSLEDYRRQIQALPALTRAQRDAFPHFVADAHSWYKRLPLLGPGSPFVLFLDPAAGCDRVQRVDGSFEGVPREVSGFHYTAIPTKEYRESYGCLAFASGQSLRSGSLAGGVVRVETGFGATVLDENGAFRSVPEEVEAGAVYLTSIIHPFANQLTYWMSLARKKLVPGLWPEESGGLVAFEQIQRRCRELVDDPSIAVWDGPGRGVDAVFADLVEPERERQRQLMVGAIERLLALLGLSCAP